MEDIKIRVKISADKNHSVPVGEFLSVSNKIIDFIKETCESLNINADINSWTAGKFRNQSIGYCIQGVMEDNQHKRFTQEIESILNIDIEQASYVSAKKTELFKKYLSIADQFTNGGEVRIGLINRNNRRLKYHVLNRTIALKAKQVLAGNDTDNINTYYTYYGSLQGVIYTWHKEGNKPYIEIKDAKTGDNIKCYYQDEFYDDIYKTLAKKHSQILVSGEIKMNKGDNKILSLIAKGFDVVDRLHCYQDGDVDKFFGCVDGLTEGTSAREYIEGIRDDEE